LSGTGVPPVNLSAQDARATSKLNRQIHLAQNFLEPRVAF